MSIGKINKLQYCTNRLFLSKRYFSLLILSEIRKT